jgi:hypothetical protein
MSTKISMMEAQLADPAAMREFLASIPEGDQLAKVLENTSGVSSRAYEDETWIARFVASDGHTVRCFAVSDITIDQAEMIAAVGMDLMACDTAEFSDMVALALGPTL